MIIITWRKCSREILEKETKLKGSLRLARVIGKAFLMAQVEFNPRTVPIAIVLAGAIFGSAVAYAYSQHPDSLLGAIVVVAVLIFIASIGVAAYLYHNERKEFWEHSMFH